MLSLQTDHERIAEVGTHMRSILGLLGENPNREGLQDTPSRYAKAMAFLTSGYRMSSDEVVGRGVFTEESQGPVAVEGIEFFSLCEHHLLPFYGKVDVSYLPNGRIIGLSKIPRLVDMFARRLQVQERLTRQIAEELHRILAPRGVTVRIEAMHMCMMMRGVEKQNGLTKTQHRTGEYL